MSQTRDTRPVLRCHWRALLRETADETALVKAAEECRGAAQTLISQGKLMTAALFRYGRQLFLYFECIGEELPPETLMAAMSPLLTPWPQKDTTRDWARMYHVYWHCEPVDAEDWREGRPRQRRRGRIAYLKRDKLFDYVTHHRAIVEEGLLRGDKYMSIALHEDVLFSYFEEPRSSVNILRTEEGESRAIQAWEAVDPESHFIHLPGSEGQNFLLLPALFDVGETEYNTKSSQ